MQQRIQQQGSIPRLNRKDQYMPVTSTYQPVPFKRFFKLYGLVPPCTSIYRSLYCHVPSCTTMYRLVPPCTQAVQVQLQVEGRSTYWYVLPVVCTVIGITYVGTYWYVPVHTVMYCLVPLAGVQDSKFQMKTSISKSNLKLCFQVCYEINPYHAESPD